jgi:hypothetical protein
MHKGERMKITIFLRRRAAKRDDSTTGAVSDLIRGGVRQFISPWRYFFPAITGVLERVFFFSLGC